MSDESIFVAPDEEGFIQEPSVDIFANAEIQQNLIDYLVAEVEEVASNSGRTVRMERNEKIKRQRMARPEEEIKDFPWENSANVTPPMLLQKVNTVATKMMATLLEKKPLFTYEASAPYERHAEALTRWVQQLVEDPYGINIYEKLWPMIYDTCSLGTKFIQVPFTVERMKFNKINPQTGSPEVVDRVIRALPEIKLLPFEDFFTRTEWPDPQKAPWIGVRHYMYTHEIMEMAQQGYFANTELLVSQTDGLDDTKKQDMENMGTTPAGNQEPNNYLFTVYEIFVRWDADGDGFAEDIRIFFEPESAVILRAEYNDLGVRELMKLPYIEMPDQLYALGIGDMLSSLQDEVEALHNMRINATHLSLNPVKVVSQSADFGDDDTIYPGKHVRAAVPREDVQWMTIPDLGSSAISAEQFTKVYADEATGASQALTGADVGGNNRIGATGTQYLGSQSLQFLDSIAVQLSYKLPQIAMLILYQLVRNSDLVQLDAVSEADRPLIESILGMNVEDIPSKFKFRARVSGVQDSKQVKQQGAMALFQIYNVYGDKMIQLSSQLADPNLQTVPKLHEAMASYAVGLTKLMENMLKNYDEDEVGDYLPFIDDLKLALKLQDSQRMAEVDSIETRISEQTAGAMGETLPTDDGTEGAVGGASPSQGAAPTGIPSSAGASPGGVTVGGEAT